METQIESFLKQVIFALLWLQRYLNAEFWTGPVVTEQMSILLVQIGVIIQTVTISTNNIVLSVTILPYQNTV